MALPASATVPVRIWHIRTALPRTGGCCGPAAHRSAVRRWPSAETRTLSREPDHGPIRRTRPPLAGSVYPSGHSRTAASMAVVDRPPLRSFAARLGHATGNGDTENCFPALCRTSTGSPSVAGRNQLPNAQWRHNYSTPFREAALGPVLNLLEPFSEIELN